jgi:hypothetical protein
VGNATLVVANVLTCNKHSQNGCRVPQVSPQGGTLPRAGDCGPLNGTGVPGTICTSSGSGAPCNCIDQPYALCTGKEASLCYKVCGVTLGRSGFSNAACGEPALDASEIPVMALSCSAFCGDAGEAWPPVGVWWQRLQPNDNHCWTPPAQDSKSGFCVKGRTAPFGQTACNLFSKVCMPTAVRLAAKLASVTRLTDFLRVILAGNPPAVKTLCRLQWQGLSLLHSSRVWDEDECKAYTVWLPASGWIAMQYMLCNTRAYWQY